MKITTAANDKHAEMMHRLGELCGADEVRYQDLGKAEMYYIVKQGRTFCLSIRGNHLDGGFLGSIEEVE